MAEDTRNKIARLVHTSTRAEAARPQSRPAEPFTAAPTAYPRMVKVYLSEERYRALRVAASTDDVPTATRIRELIEVMCERSDLFAEVTERAQRRSGATSRRCL